MNTRQRIILAVGGLVFLAIGLYPPWVCRPGFRNAGHHLIFAPPSASRQEFKIDFLRLLILWICVAVATFVLMLLFRRLESVATQDSQPKRKLNVRGLKIFAITVAALLLIAASVVLVVKEVRRQALVALTQQARNDIAAVTITSRLEENFVLNNPTQWDLSDSQYSVDYLTAQKAILFWANAHLNISASVRSHSQGIYERVQLDSLPREQKSQLPQKSPFIQRVTLKFHRATKNNQTVELDPPFELVAERYFVFYPEEWGWDAPTQTSYLRGPAEFKEVASGTQKAPQRRLGGPPPPFKKFNLG